MSKDKDDKPKRTRKAKCPVCRCMVPSKELRTEPDPYASEIADDWTPVKQCEGCRQNSRDDI